VKLLYFANPNSIHDRKWISFFSRDPNNTCFVLCHPHQLDQLTIDVAQELKSNNIILIGSVPEFSTVRFWRTLTSFRFLKKLIIEKKIALIHILYAEPNALWGAGKKFLNVPFVLTTRGTDVIKTIPLFFKETSLLKIIVRSLYKKALKNFDEITSTSQSQVTALTKLIGSSISPHVIRTGIDLNPDAKLTRPKGITPPFVVFPRLMKPLYNHEFSIRALGLLPTEIKKTHQMVFVNRDAKDQTYVMSIENQMGQQTDIDFLFLDSLPHEQLQWALANASLAVMNPIHDGSTVSAMEAMYLECPLILGPLAYDQDLFGGVEKLSEWSEEELADKMERLIQSPDPSKLTKLKTQISECANRQTEMERLGAIYKGVVDGTQS